MILTVENTLNIGRRCRVYDASGAEVEKCVYCDTETGEVRRLHYRDGQPVLTEYRHEVERITEMRPLPFEIEWKHDSPTAETVEIA